MIKKPYVIYCVGCNKRMEVESRYRKKCKNCLHPRYFVKKIKDNLLEKRGYKCEICKIGFRLIIHHINKNIKNNTDKNLMVLCRSCHIRIHTKTDNVYGYVPKPKNSEPNHRILCWLVKEESIINENIYWKKLMPSVDRSFYKFIDH